MKGINEKTLKKGILEAVDGLLDAADIAESAEIRIVIDKKSIPTISYSIKGFPMIPKPIVRMGDDL